MRVTKLRSGPGIGDSSPSSRPSSAGGFEGRQLKLQGVAYSLEDLLGVDRLTSLLQALADAVQTLQHDSSEMQKTIKKGASSLEQKMDEKIAASQNMLYGYISNVETQVNNNKIKVSQMLQSVQHQQAGLLAASANAPIALQSTVTVPAGPANSGQAGDVPKDSDGGKALSQALSQADGPGAVVNLGVGAAVSVAQQNADGNSTASRRPSRSAFISGSEATMLPDMMTQKSVELEKLMSQVKSMEKSNKETLAKVARMERSTLELLSNRDLFRKEIDKDQQDIADLYKQLRIENTARMAADAEHVKRMKEGEEKVESHDSQIADLKVSIGQALTDIGSQTQHVDRMQKHFDEQRREFAQWSDVAHREFDKINHYFQIMGGVEKVKSDLEGLREMRKQVTRTETAAVAACAEAERAISVVEVVDQNHQRGVSVLRGSLESLADTITDAFSLEGARATNKCLSCAEKIPQKPTATLNGEDNKPYLAGQSAIQTILQKMRRQMDDNCKELQAEVPQSALRFTDIGMDNAKRGAWRRPLSARPGTRR
eukprot:gnl/MRDRNA2_/MRDRNA2_95726_c0_seq1.p1 gnl/MRDRNA2_/MRDRNA2_95726_c0~~gnl/MRDRNA2_/MRDRNA2_95726_c0_seq1.p1  ORF type:complete len:543 (-),score=119.28 gnl/MRDRNA2_/MRDRNA2_95726_c0_seq1:173-1801(-)